jgi:pimeloyl-ACP methyl ester carboxylesterase
MDLRGYGGSDKTPRGYDPLTLARDVVGVVKALGERRAVVVGHGWGGYVGWVAATLHPKEISALCSVAAPHPRVMLRAMRGPGGAKATGHVLAMQLPMVPERRLAKPESGYLAAHVKGWSGPESEFPDNATLATYQDAISLWPAAHCALEYHRWLFRSRFRYDGRQFDRLMQQPARQPVCLVRGDADPALPRPERDDSRAAVAGPVEEHVMRGVGHFPPEEQPEAFTDLLLGWLDRAGQDRRAETAG